MQKSVCIALRRVTLLLNREMAAFIHFPTTRAEIDAAKAAWYNIRGGGTTLPSDAYSSSGAESLS